MTTNGQFFLFFFSETANGQIFDDVKMAGTIIMVLP